MKQFKMKISTQTDNNMRKNVATNKSYLLRKIGYNIKTLHFMQNSILKQPKVAEKGVDYMVQAGPVREQPV